MVMLHDQTFAQLLRAIQSFRFVIEGLQLYWGRVEVGASCDKQLFPLQTHIHTRTHYTVTIVNSHIGDTYN